MSNLNDALTKFSENYVIGSCTCTLVAEDEEIRFETKFENTETFSSFFHQYSQHLRFGSYFIQSYMQINYIIGQFPQAIQFSDKRAQTKVTKYFELDLTKESEGTLVTLEVVQTSTQTIKFNTRFEGNIFHADAIIVVVIPEYQYIKAYKKGPIAPK